MNKPFKTKAGMGVSEGSLSLKREIGTSGVAYDNFTFSKYSNKLKGFIEVTIFNDEYQVSLKVGANRTPVKENTEFWISQYGLEYAAGRNRLLAFMDEHVLASTGYAEYEEENSSAPEDNGPSKVEQAVQHETRKTVKAGR